MKGFGTVVTGTLVSGRIAVDDELALAPGGTRVKVRGVQVHGAAAAGRRRGPARRRQPRRRRGRRDRARPEPRHARRVRGDARRRRGVELLPGAKPLKHGARVRFHQGTAEMLGPRIADRSDRVDSGRTPASQPGATRRSCGCGSKRPAVLARGDRYILRAYSPPVTIGGGYILDPRPPRTAIRTRGGAARCERLDFDPTQRARRDGGRARGCEVMIDDAGAAGLLGGRAGVARRHRSARVEARIDALVQRRTSPCAPATCSSPRRSSRALEGRARSTALTRASRGAAAVGGLPREEAREQLFARGDAGGVRARARGARRAASAIVAPRSARAGDASRWSCRRKRSARATAIERAFRDGRPDAARRRALAERRRRRRRRSPIAC